MKKKTVLFSLCLCFVFLFCGATGIAASGYYADEEAAEADCFSVVPQQLQLNDVNYDGKLVLVIDPGHTFTGHNAIAGTTIGEADCNLAVAKAFKAYLESHVGDKITVYLTRETCLTRGNGNTELSLQDRAKFAAEHGADLMISCHFNAGGGTGGEVYVSRLEEYELTDLGKAIMSGLSDLGIRDRGIKTRKSESGNKWLDGRDADYYGIIYHPACKQVPSCIIEHCFYDTEYAQFMNSEAKLKALGESDAKAVISYFGLDQTESATTLENTRITALNELNSLYEAITNKAQSIAVKSIYDDAVQRISAANNTGKINLTFNRAYKTIKNYSSDIFTDVKSGNWFYTAVLYCYEHNLFMGTSDTSFSPAKNITRGEFITVIGRNNGVEQINPTETVFTDVAPTRYYASHIKWAYENKIVEGTSETTFSPDTPITREQLVKIIYGYAQFANIEVADNGTKSYDDFKDTAKVSSWATESMSWAIQKGIINGDNTGKINPTACCTRAEAAQIIMNFNKNSVKPE